MTSAAEGLRTGGALVFLLGLAATACATQSPSLEIVSPGAGGDRVPGYRALFRVETERPGSKERFKMAAAIAPPDRMRLEFYGPVGGARLVLAVDGGTAVVLQPNEQLYEWGRADAETLERLVGLPLDGRNLIALLMGMPMCGAETVEQEVQTRAAATFGRTLAWFEVTCPPGEIRYQARCEERGGILKEATVRDGISGTMILRIEYEEHREGLGPRWPGRLRLQLPRQEATISLAAVQGPAPGEVDETLFRPPVPPGFEKRSLRIGLLTPGFLGSPGDGTDDSHPGGGLRQD